MHDVVIVDAARSPVGKKNGCWPFVPSLGPEKSRGDQYMCHCIGYHLGWI